VAKVKVINNNLDSNLNGINFNNAPSETIFSLGNFSITSNFDGRTPIDYTTKLSTFVRPVTLETIGITETQSEILYDFTTKAVLNLDKSDLNTFVRFGSAYEFLRISIQNIILKYPSSLFVNSQVVRGGNHTFYDYIYDSQSNTSKFKIPINYIINTFGLVYDFGNTSEPDDSILKNLNLSFDDYIVWSSLNPTNNTCKILEFTGFTTQNDFLCVKVLGNPFSTISGSTARIDFHLKPNNIIFEEFRAKLNDYEKHILSNRVSNGFKFVLKEPTLLNDGTIIYSDSEITWPTNDLYNIEIDSSAYRKFLEIVLTFGSKYDAIKTDLIARFLTPTSLKTYDLTDNGKYLKLLRVYGYEFDRMREFIDSLVYINRVTYDKINNIPDQLIKNLSKTLGWEYFSLVNENELVESFLAIDENERNLKTDLLPAEIDIELWRRILINTNYLWKSKGTREAIKSIFLMIGIPEPFINITEYVYCVDGKIDPRTVTLSQIDFPSNSLPYDTEGYPVAPLETNSFYFQISGDSDSGQAYLDVFRMAGFNLKKTVDNKKSWIQTGSTTRIHNTTPQYYQEDSKLVINTKEVDVALDTARGIEYDVYQYIKNTDFPANSSGYTLPYNYVNVSLGVSTTQNTFTLPFVPEGDVEVRFNGILLNAPKTGLTSNITFESDYIVSGNTVVLKENAINSGNRRDVVQITQIYSANTTTSISGISVQYMVSRIKANISGTIIPLPSSASGDVQITINGIALTKGTNQFNADYVLDPNNSNQIIIQNQEVISYLAINPVVQVAYVNVNGTTSIAARNELIRVDSFNSGKIYFNNSANKYVYKLNYKMNNASDVKVLVNGIALEPNVDYTLNNSNPYEIILPRGIRLGSVISLYYLVGGSDYFEPVINDAFGIGDISKLSFLEFIDLMERKMINTSNRKTVTDSIGGWYPTLLKVYVDYLKRANISPNNPLLSNGYTFQNLYPFLSKYNAFFQRFVDQILPATIILGKSGLLIRNTLFTKQKFTYKRGINMGIINNRINNNTTFLPDTNLNYFGDDGSTFMKRPLSQDINWSDDYVCTNELCSNFIVDSVEVYYPITTTTTTIAPYIGLLFFNETIESTNTPTFKYTVSRSTLELSPSMVSIYEATINLGISISYSGDTLATQSQVSVSVLKNGVVINTLNYTNNEIGLIQESDTIEFNANSMDIYELVVENTMSVINSTIPIYNSYSIVNIIPTINEITPNGEITGIEPDEINVEVYLNN